MALFLVSCSMDNYSAPDSVLSGRVVDHVTGEGIENGGVNDGTVIRLFEGASAQPILCRSFSDGHFVNAALFSGSYKLQAVGAFRMIEETINIQIIRNTEVEIRVLPNVRLETTLQNLSGANATVKVRYELPDNSIQLDELSLVWSTLDNPNLYSFQKGGSKTVKLTDLSEGEHIFDISGLTPGTKYYIRAAARTTNSGNYYNYSKTISSP